MYFNNAGQAGCEVQHVYVDIGIYIAFGVIYCTAHYLLSVWLLFRRCSFVLWLCDFGGDMQGAGSVVWMVSEASAGVVPPCLFMLSGAGRGGAEEQAEEGDLVHLPVGYDRRELVPVEVVLLHHLEFLLRD